jgi:uncharacterized protein YdeI (BOF family)
MSKNFNIRVEKQIRQSSKVVNIRGYIVDRIVNDIFAIRKDIKRIMIVAETTDEQGHVWSNMCDSDAFYFMDKYKQIRMRRL